MKRKAIRILGIALGCLVMAGGCSDPTEMGTIVYGDASNYGDGGSVAFGDAGVHGDAAGGQADAIGGGGQDGGQSTADGAVPPTSELRFVSENDDFGGSCDTICALLLNQNGIRSLSVQYLRNGQPQGDALVEFALKDPTTALGEVVTANVPTGDDGVAWTDVKSASQLGVLEVIARVPEDPEAGELLFQVHVVSKAKGPLTITLHYVGSKSLAEFGEIKARLTKQGKPGEPACKDIDLGDTPPQATWISPNIKWDKPWAITYPNFPASLPQTGEPVAYTVVGLAWGAGKTSLMDKPVAGGCIDTGVTVYWNPVTKTVEGDSATVDVMDIPPRLKGTYDLTSHIDLVSVLPDPIENIFKMILDIVSDPVAGILSMTCKLTNGSIDSLCQQIFEDPKNPNIKKLAQPFGGIIVQFLDAILLSFLPESVKTGLATGADLAEILTNLEMGGVIEIHAEPDNTGFLAKDFTKQSWTSVTYKWSLGQSCNKYDPNCGKKTFNIEAFQSDAIIGKFDLWRDAFKSEITIGKHGLNIKWGALVNYIVQKQLLPALTFDKNNPAAPPIDSYAKLIKSLLAGKACLVKDTCCDEFGASLASKQGLLKADFLSSTCEVMVTLGSGFLEAQLMSLDVDSGDPTKNSGLLLGTNACAIFDVDQDQLIDSLGAKSLPCEWDMTLTIGGKPQPIKSQFFATRQQ